MQKGTVILMAKVPIPGQVKTRLFEYLTPEQCAELYTSCLLDIIDCVSASGLELQVAFAPLEGENLLKELLPPGVSLFPQEGDSLGQRMHNAVNRFFRISTGKCIIIGGDIPTLQPRHFWEASNALENCQVCLGPAEDGGYYLIGLNKTEKSLFEGVTWGSERVLAETLKKIQGLGMNYHLLPMLRDIDRFDDLLQINQQLTLERHGLDVMPCRTRAYLQQLDILRGSYNE